MPEMPLAGEDHGDAVLVAGGDNFVVAAGAARLDDRGNTRLGGAVDRVVEREKRIRGEHGAAGPIAGFFQGDFDRIDAAHLARASSDEHAIFGDDDRVGFHESTYDPGEMQVGLLSGTWFDVCDRLPLRITIGQIVGGLTQHSTADLAKFASAVTWFNFPDG